MPFRIEMPDYELEQQLLKYDNTAILVIGPQEWYDNLCKQYTKYGETWLQNSKKLNSVVIDYFNTKISNHNFIAIYGYVTATESQICYRFEIDKILSKGIKSPPPDKTAPPFSKYDIEKGKCAPSKFEYHTWFHVNGICKIGPFEMTEFINVRKNTPIRSCSGQAHYYISVPDKILKENGVKL